MSLSNRLLLSNNNYKSLFYNLIVAVFVLFLTSCNVVKRLKSDEHLITKNVIEEDGKINSEERVNNIIAQKVNTGIFRS